MKHTKCSVPFFFFAILLSGLVSGCAKETDSTIVREKQEPNTDAYKETDAPDNISVAERLQIPERYTYSTQSKDGVLQLTCDAPVTVPDAVKLPVYKVTPEPVSQEWIDRITDTFFGDAPVYEGNACLPDPEIYGSTPPENPQKTKCIPRLEGPANTPELFYGIVEMESGTYSYKLKRTEADTLKAEILRKNPKAMYHTLYWDSGYYDSGAPALYGGPTKEEAETLAGITPDQARETAEQYLKQLGLEDFSAKSTVLSLCWYYPENIYSMDSACFLNAGYLVSCTRNLNGIPVTDESSFPDPASNMDAPWGYETVEFHINQDGLQQAVIRDLCHIEEQIVENVELKNFPEIKDMFEQAVPIDYMETDALQVNVTVSDIRLGYMRIYDVGVGSASGLLIPVWDFFGSKVFSGSRAYPENSDSYTYAEPNQSLLTINAANGTVVQRNLGY